jgi:phosphate transport system substrate-binding protein
MIAIHGATSTSGSTRRPWYLLVAYTLVAMMPVPRSAEGWAASITDRITIVGSSTIYPFSTLVAEHFAKSGPFSPPVVHSTSTAEGFKLFCAGSGTDTPDISNASRPISEAERANCVHNGVVKIAEIRIGYDSLILANSLKAEALSITLDQLWRAAAEFVPSGGRLVPNPYRQWHDIAPSLPARPIKLFGPGTGHGTRDTFVELIMEPGCRAAWPAPPGPAESARASCATIRKDGGWTDAEEMELILGKLASNPEAVGILTYSYLEQFRNRIHAATVDGVAPSRATVPSGMYPLSRPLFIYVKESHLQTRVGLADYAAEFVSLCAAGAHGYLVDEGLVPLPTSELLNQRAAVARLQR